jgi:hypothetical protein
VILPALEDHLATHFAGSPDSFLLTGEKGGPLRPHVLQSAWERPPAARPPVSPFPRPALQR